MLDQNHQETVTFECTGAAYQFRIAGQWLQGGMADVCDAAAMLKRPSTIYRPRIFVDGDKWCALYGENLQDGVAGFGESPEAAFADFDRAWKEPLRAALQPGEGSKS